MKNTAKDPAAVVRFQASEAASPADLVGRVVAVSSDGAQLTLRLPPANGDATPLVSVKMSGSTKIQYGKLPKDLQKPTVGLMAAVWLEKGTSDMAVAVRFGGPVKRPPAVDPLFAIPEGIELTPRQQIQVDALLERLAPARADLVQRKSAVLTPKQQSAQATAEKEVKEAGLTDPGQIQIAKNAAALITPRQQERLQAIARREADLRQFFLDRLSAMLTDEQKTKLPRH